MERLIAESTRILIIDDSQVYVIVDVESDGPVPGMYSMLSIGAIASTKKQEISNFYRKLKPLTNASKHDKTMQWWSSQPEA